MEKNYTLEFGVETGEQVSEEFQAENDAEALKLATARIAGGEGLITGIALYGDNVSWEYSYCELEWIPLHEPPVEADLKIKLALLAKLLLRARSSVDYQMGSQNQNTDAGKAHIEGFKGLLVEIDSAISEYRTQGGEL